MKTMPNPSTRRILTSDIPPTPWKNGGGVTREIATGGAPEAAGGWGWRVSLAEVAQDGPFSSFPEVDRTIAVIAGAGMDLLRADGSTLALEPFQPVSFAGEEALSGRLRGGPVRDLNVMVRRGHFVATMKVLVGSHGTALRCDHHDSLLIYNLAGGCTLREAGGELHWLAPSETLIHEGSGRFDLTIPAAGRTAVISIKRR